jgi:hypothetical protein
VLESANMHIDIEKLKVCLLYIGQGLFQMKEVPRLGFFVFAAQLSSIRYKSFGIFL